MICYRAVLGLTRILVSGDIPVFSLTQSPKGDLLHSPDRNL